jgi:chemotaxis protein MotB
MRRRPPPQEEPVDESWMATFADAITLLMAFFVMLLTFAEYDIPAFDEAAAAISERVGGTASENPSGILRRELEDQMYDMQADQAVEISKDSRGIVIEIRGGAFFKPGSAEIRPAAEDVLREISKKISKPKFKCFYVEVIGHTDDMPIRSDRFPTNWELSAARAARIVRFFGENQVEKNRLKASGFADTKPKVPNLDDQGRPIAENRATNRRIEVKIERMNVEDQKRCNSTANLKKMLKQIK